MTAYENAKLAVGCLVSGDSVLVWSPRNHYQQTATQGNLALHQDPVLVFDNLLIESIESAAVAEDTTVYNLLLDGDHTYVADDYLVHNKGGDDSGGSGSGSSGSGSSGSGSSGSGSSGSGSSGSGSSGSGSSGSGSSGSGSSGSGSSGSGSSGSGRVPAAAKVEAGCAEGR
jgi:hypothetical protein